MKTMTLAFTAALAAAASLASACGDAAGAHCDEEIPCADPEQSFCDLLGEHGPPGVCIALPDGGALEAACSSDQDCAFPQACQEIGTCNLETGACEHPVKPAGTVCREAAGSCDVAKVCDGEAPGCPADERRPAGFECRPAAGPCDVAESCDGVDPVCPADAKRSGVQCRAAQGACDLPAVCDGASDACPANPFRPSTHVCRAATGPCDEEERCTGSSASCPTDAVKPAGHVCPSDGNPCTSGSCDGTSKQCTHLPLGTGTSCPGGKCCGSICCPNQADCSGNSCLLP
jgi:hypothetical protein